MVCLIPTLESGPTGCSHTYSESKFFFVFNSNTKKAYQLKVLYLAQIIQHQHHLVSTKSVGGRI